MTWNFRLFRENKKKSILKNVLEQGDANWILVTHMRSQNIAQFHVFWDSHGKLPREYFG